MEFYKRMWMKRCYLLVVITLVSLGCSQAQSFSEWFKQKKTQKKYLLAQIAVLESYAQEIEKGYDVARGGLSSISALKDSDFMQHTLHFSSLQMVSSNVKKYSKILAITEMEDRSEKLRRDMMRIKDLDVFLSIQEIAALRQVNTETSSEVAKDLEQLELLVTDGKLKMSDDARISHIDQIYTEVKKKYGNTMMLVQNIQALISGRKKRATDTRILKQLYGN